MKPFKKAFYSLHPFLLSSIGGALTAAQFVLIFFLRGDGSDAFNLAGWICLWTAGFFGLIPIITFRRKGGVAKGESYIKTTELVDTGIYAVVRHPQGGTCWLLINLGLMLIAWHWTGTILGLVSMALAYIDSFKTDYYCIEKFGDDYKQYIKRVPRVNFVTGIIRLLLRRGRMKRNR